MRAMVRRLLLLGLLLVSSLASAVVPERGLYWDPNAPGRGYYIEVQNGVVVMVAYAYNETTGRPEFYIASGALQEGAFTQFDPTLYEPRHGFAAAIYRTSGGPCLGCDGIPDFDTSKNAERVGTVRMDFISLEFAYAEITALGGAGETTLSLSRQVFAYPPVSPPGADWLSYNMPDLRGEWLFSDQSDSSRAPWRFVFDSYTKTTETISGIQIDVYTFRDTGRSAEFRCIYLNTCELRQNGTVLFSVFVPDIGIHQMQGVLGPAPTFPVPDRLAHDGKMVIGLRVEKPPAASGP